MSQTNRFLSYRWTLVLAVFLHVLVLLLLIYCRPQPQSYRVQAIDTLPQVQAQAVSQRQIDRRLHAIKRREEAKQAVLQRAKQSKIRERKRLLAKKRRAKRLKLEKKRQAALTKKKQQQALALKRKQGQEAKRLMDQMLDQQLATENNQIKQAVSQQVQAVVDRYKGIITGKISQNWVLPAQLAHNLKATFLIQLAPGGVIISVKLLKSSGNGVLDRSAKTAVLKSSPLPVPKDPALFDNFRNLRLTVRPQITVDALA